MMRWIWEAPFQPWERAVLRIIIWFTVIEGALVALSLMAWMFA